MSSVRATPATSPRNPKSGTIGAAKVVSLLAAIDNLGWLRRAEGVELSNAEPRVKGERGKDKLKSCPKGSGANMRRMRDMHVMHVMHRPEAKTGGDENSLSDFM